MRPVRRNSSLRSIRYGRISNRSAGWRCSTPSRREGRALRTGGRHHGAPGGTYARHHDDHRDRAHPCPGHRGGAGDFAGCPVSVPVTVQASSTVTDLTDEVGLELLRALTAARPTYAFTVVLCIGTRRRVGVPFPGGNFLFPKPDSSRFAPEPAGGASGRPGGRASLGRRR
jgi:hypothetical protein